jgi:ADP-heptose:LPS heptosyltransferase
MTDSENSGNDRLPLSTAGSNPLSTSSLAKILVIRLKSIGDVILTLPATDLIRENFPAARIVFLTSKENASIVEGFAAVDEIMVLDREPYRRLRLVTIVQQTVELWRCLRRERFDLVVDFQGYGETALCAWLTRAPHRWGMALHASRRWALTRTVKQNGTIHPAERHRQMLTDCGLRPTAARNEFRLSEAAVVQARSFCTQRGLGPSKPILYLQPFTSSAGKNWPIQKYLALARHWRQNGLEVIFSGGRADLPALEPACAEGFVVAAGLPLQTVFGLLHMAALVVGGDTGLLHLAVALQRRVLMLIKPRGTGAPVPYRHPEWAITPAPSDPVESIDVGRVLKASAAALRQSRIVAGDVPDPQVAAEQS